MFKHQLDNKMLAWYCLDQIEIDGEYGFCFEENQDIESKSMNIALEPVHCVFNHNTHRNIYKRKS